MHMTRTSSPVATGDHLRLSCLAPIGEAPDWRLVVIYAAAAETGLLSALPGTSGELAERALLDEGAVRTTLEALAAFGVVEVTEGRYVRASEAATGDDDIALRHHAWVIRRWAAELESHLRGIIPTPSAPSLSPVGLRFMALDARLRAPIAVNACLARHPQARRVLDIGGGHGELALAFTQRGLRVTLQDLPATIEAVRRDCRLAEADVEMFASDVFEALPEGPFDIVACSALTASFTEAQNRELFRRVLPLLSPNGVLLIVTMFRGSRPLVSCFSVFMLIMAQSSGTHTEECYRKWLKDAGYQKVETIDVNNGLHSMLLVTA
jgi:2-polyprenyl-3-methyl-5-hydroxy-6-metoxy-1,4-benzoquinol methylase